MMLSKLSLKNIRKSFKDYAIYFLTLILGVAIFYIFNAMDSQQAVLDLNAAKKEILDLMNNFMGGFSVFISFVLGFLIIYANRFLIKRRNKEFGIYMTLGMGKGQMSRMLVIETLIIGLISLTGGLLLGILLSQFMSFVVANLFAVDMSNYKFIFSSAAMLKTVLCFGIMYLLVMVFNAFSVSKCKLIDLLTAGRKNEKIKVKNPIISVIVFIISLAILGTAYYLVTNQLNGMSFTSFLGCIVMGIIGTIIFFWALSGFVLRLVQSNKKLYLKNLNIFVLRQINSKVNTTVFSMSVICILLFFTICVFSSAMSLNRSMTANLSELTPNDVQIELYADNSDGFSVKDKLIEENYNLDNFKNYTEAKYYMFDDLTVSTTLGSHTDGIAQRQLQIPEEVMRISEYNKIAEIMHKQTYSLSEGEYMIVADYDEVIKLRDKALKDNKKITVDGNTYSPKYDECKDGFVEMGQSHMNPGIILLPDSAEFNADKTISNFVANYKTTDEKEITDLNKMLEEQFIYQENSGDIYRTDINTKQNIYEASIGIGAIATFLGLYLGIIFLISSAAILAIKELSESSDNKARYQMLRKIGADEKMINKCLFAQIGIFFLMPLILAIVHSIFGMQVASNMLTMFGREDIMSSIILTAILLVVIYGGYFLLTYFSSKRIIKEK